MNYEYYYNNVPKKGKCRNNLIYTSLISSDYKTFVKWFHNDSDYHKGKNEVVDPSLMKEKFDQEVRGLLYVVEKGYENIVPRFDINYKEQKIYFEIDGADLWEQAGCDGKDYSHILPDWKEQMLDIFSIYKNIGLFKYSLHPSSYFVINGELKSINYFFSYIQSQDPPLAIRSVLSHISKERQHKLFQKIEEFQIDIDSPTPLKKIQMLAFESFKTNFDNEVMEAAKEIYKDI